MSTKRLETIVVKQVMTKVKEEKMPFGWSINPYRGCAHGCSFCYARAFQSFIGLGSDDFQNIILVKDNAAEALRKQLHNMAATRSFDLQELARDIGHIAIGTATDPYQPAESSRQVTRECLQVLARYRVPVSITTRSPLIVRDMDILSEVNLLSVNISLNSLDDGLIRFMEPGSPLPRQRLQALSEIRSAGLPAGIFAAPILPLLTDSRIQLDELMSASKSAGAEFMMTSLLRLSPDVKKWYYGRLQQYDSALIPSYDRLFAGAYASRDYADGIQALVSELRLLHGMPEVPLHRGAGEAPAVSGYSGLTDKLARLRKIPGAGCTPGMKVEVLEQMSLPF